MSSLDDIFDPDRIRHRFDELKEFRETEEAFVAPRLTIMDHIDAFRIEAKPYLQSSTGLRLLFDEAERLIRRLLKLDPRLPSPSFVAEDDEEEAAIEVAVSQAIAMPGGAPLGSEDPIELLAMLDHTLNAIESLLEALSCSEMYPARPAIVELANRYARES